ncbi:MAG TPA: hydrogenase [Candidatus Eisenbacteria bacterium]|jgi:hydrogenase-4 component E
MTGTSDLLLLLIVVTDLIIVASSRLTTSIRASAIQGAMLAALPVLLRLEGSSTGLIHVSLMAIGLLVIKAIAIPSLLTRALREADVPHEVEPFLDFHVSLLLAAALVGMSFWLATTLILPRPAPSMALVPAALATLLIGFLVLVSRRQAISQVVGYLLLENGVFIFGQTLAAENPFVVELGILLDVLVGVFVMGIAIHHISRAFDHIDTEQMTSLRG